MYIHGSPRGRRRRCPLHGDYCYDPYDPARCPLFYEGEAYGAGGLGDLDLTEARRSKVHTDAKGTLYDIPDSDKGTEATVMKMADLIRDSMLDPFVVKNAMRVVLAYRPSIKRKDYVGEMLALFRYAQGTHPTLGGLRYFKDTWHAEKLQSARRTEEFGGSDCDDLVIWLCSHLLALGHGPVRLVVVAADAGRPDEYSHVFLWCAHPQGRAIDPEDGTHWIPMDPTVSKPMGWEIDHPFRKSYFQVDR